MRWILPFAALVSLSCNKVQTPLQVETLQAIALNVDDVDPKSLVPTPSKLDFAVGESIDISLTGLFPYNRISVLNKGITWASADTSLVTIDSEGIARARTPGSTVLSVRYRDAYETIPVTIREAAPMQIILLPKTSVVAIPSQLGVLQTKEFSIDTFALLTNGNLSSIAADVSWEISDPSGLELISESKFLAKRPGEYELLARYGNLRAKHRVVLTAIPLAVARLELTGSNFVIRYGDRLALPVRAVMNDGQIVTNLSQANFLSSNNGISVSGGEIVAGNLGKHWVKVSLGGQEITVPITVRDADVTAIVITPGAIPLSLGQRLSLTAVATFSNGETLNITTAMTTSVTNTSIATVNGPELTAVANGSSSLNVSYKGYTQSALINVGNATLRALDIRPASFTLSAGETATYQVFGLYTNGTETNITNLVTTRGLLTSKADVHSAGILTAKVEGTTKLSSTYLDPITGQNLTTNVPITILPAYLQSLVFEPPVSSKALGRAEEFRVKGRYSDTTEVDITNLVNITVDVTSAGLSYCASVARTNTNKIRVIGLTLGSQKIIATYSSFSGEAVFTATPKELDKVDIVRLDTNVASGQIDKGLQARFIALGTYSDLSTENVTYSNASRTVTWNVPDVTKATFVDNGAEKRFTAVTEGDATFSFSLVDSVGTKSDRFNIGVYIPCASPGRRVSYYCWYLGGSGANCVTACSSVSRGYHSATASYAGSGGTDEACRDLVGDTFSTVIDASFSASASAPVGAGCSIYVENGLDIGLREETIATTDTAAQAFFRRVCSCE
ncbi:MAG: hypothetical protein V4655_08780 [Bdellovibrionota bacterium]